MMERLDEKKNAGIRIHVDPSKVAIRNECQSVLPILIAPTELLFYFIKTYVKQLRSFDLILGLRSFQFSL